MATTTGSVVYTSEQISGLANEIYDTYARGPEYNISITSGSYPSSFTVTKVKIRINLSTASTHNIYVVRNGSTSTSQTIGYATAANSTGAITYTLKNLKTSLRYDNLSSIKLVGNGGSGGTILAGSTITLTVYYETTETNSPSTFTLASSTVKAGGSALSVTIKAVQSTNRHVLAVSAVGYSGSVSIAAGTVTGSYSIPANWSNGLPNGVTATGTVTLTTYDSSNATVGSNSASFTFQVADSAVPTCSYSSTGTSATIVLDTSQQVGGNLYANFSAIRFQVSNVGGSYGSTIRTASITFNGTTKSTTVGNVIDFDTVDTGGAYASAGQPITMSVTDSRGRTGSYSLTTFEIKSYTPFVVTGADTFVQRCIVEQGVASLSISGNRGLMTVPVTWYTPASGDTYAASISPSVKVSFINKGIEASDPDPYEWDEHEVINDIASPFVLPGEFEVDKQYTITILISDGILSRTYSFNLKSAYAFMYWDPNPAHNRFGFGCYPNSTYTGALELGGDWDIYRTANNETIKVFDSLSALKGVGSFYSDKDTAGTSVASGAAATLLTLHLPYPEEGVYVCQASVNFGTAVNGTKAICITKSATNSPDGRVYGTSQVQSGTFGISGNTVLNTVFICTIDPNDTSGDIYLRVYQNSGSALTLTGSMYAVRIK